MQRLKERLTQQLIVEVDRIPAREDRWRLFHELGADYSYRCVVRRELTIDEMGGMYTRCCRSSRQWDYAQQHPAAQVD